MTNLRITTSSFSPSRLLVWLFISLCWAGTPAIAQQSDDTPQGLVEGVDYFKVAPPMPTRATAGKIEVLEFFNFICPHCYRLQPHLKKWWAGADTEVIHLDHFPVKFDRTRGLMAQLYYTVQSFDDSEQWRADIFRTIHKERQLLNSESRIIDWLTERGIDEARAEGIFSSFSVMSKTNAAIANLPRYGVNSTPQFVVDGKYRVTSQVGSYSRMFQIIDQLVAHSAKQRAGGNS